MKHILYALNTRDDDLNVIVNLAYVETIFLAKLPQGYTLQLFKSEHSLGKGLYNTEEEARNALYEITRLMMPDHSIEACRAFVDSYPIYEFTKSDLSHDDVSSFISSILDRNQPND